MLLVILALSQDPIGKTRKKDSYLSNFCLVCSSQGLGSAVFPVEAIVSIVVACFIWLVDYGTLTAAQFAETRHNFGDYE